MSHVRKKSIVSFMLIFIKALFDNEIDRVVFNREQCEVMYEMLPDSKSVIQFLSPFNNLIFFLCARPFRV